MTVSLALRANLLRSLVEPETSVHDSAEPANLKQVEMQCRVVVQPWTVQWTQIGKSVILNHSRSNCSYLRKGYFASPGRQPGGLFFVKLSRGGPPLCSLSAVAAITWIQYPSRVRGESTHVILASLDVDDRPTNSICRKSLKALYPAIARENLVDKVYAV